MSYVHPTELDGPLQKENELSGGPVYHMGNRRELLGSEGNELPGKPIYRMEGRRELHGSNVAEELQNSNTVMELGGSPVGPEYYERTASRPALADASFHVPSDISSRN